MSAGATADLMVCALAREVRDDDVVGVGLGTPLALCAALVARRTGAPRAEVLVAGALSPEADLLTCLRGAGALAGRAAAFVPHLATMDMAERQAMTLQFLRPAQVDGRGSLNTSRLPGADGAPVRFPGGLATADVPGLLPRLVVYHPDHRPRSLPATLGFVTGAGGERRVGRRRSRGPVRLVTDRAVIAFLASGPRLVSVHRGGAVGEVVAATGFALQVPPVVPYTPEPDAAERAALADVDTHRLRELELRATRPAAAARLGDLLHPETRTHA